MILDDLRDAHATFSSNEDDLLQPLPLLPMEEIERHILSIIESRNKKLTETLDNMTNVVQEISEIFKQHVKQQDDAFLDQITSQVNSVQDIIDDQECLRDQVARFAEATSFSFAEIFNPT